MKQCKNCGAEYEENTAFCGGCGSSLPQELYQAPQDPYQQNPYSQQSYAPNNPYQQQYAPPQQQFPGQPYPYGQPGITDPYRKYHKLGGWLLFFVIANILGAVTTIVTQLAGIFETIAVFAEVEALGEFRQYIPENFETALNITLVGEIIGLLTVLFTILFIVQVFRRKSTFLRYHQLGLLVGLVNFVLVSIVPNIMLNAIEADIPYIIGYFFGITVAFFLVALYMSKSVRVRTYMGSDEYMYKAIFAFRNQPPLTPQPQYAPPVSPIYAPPPGASVYSPPDMTQYNSPVVPANTQPEVTPFIPPEVSEVTPPEAPQENPPEEAKQD